MYFCFFKQKTAYEMRISDWSSDVCSSDLSVSASRCHLPMASPQGGSELFRLFFQIQDQRLAIGGVDHPGKGHARSGDILHRRLEIGVEGGFVPDAALRLHRARIGETRLRRDERADDAVQIGADAVGSALFDGVARNAAAEDLLDRKSTRLNSSH